MRDGLRRIYIDQLRGVYVKEWADHNHPNHHQLSILSKEIHGLARNWTGDRGISWDDAHPLMGEVASCWYNGDTQVLAYPYEETMTA
jgi:hypothetical protein